MKLKNLIQNQVFKDKHILFLLIEHILWYNKEQAYLNREKEISDNKFEKIKNLYNKYEKEKIPIEYILWYCEFMWEKFIVNENTLIPRPETEYLIKYVLDYLNKEDPVSNTGWHQLENSKSDSEWLKSWNPNPILQSWLNPEISFQSSDNLLNKSSAIPYIIDIWTGSWIIWIILNKITKIPTICIDIDKNTLKVAKKNNQNINLNSKNITFIKSDLLSNLNEYFISSNSESILKSWINPEVLNQFWNPRYIVCSNLPYLEDEYKLDNLAEKEPKKALYAWKDGLDLYRKLLNQLKQVKYKKICFFELTNKQAQILSKEYNLKNYKILETCHKNIKILKLII